MDASVKVFREGRLVLPSDEFLDRNVDYATVAAFEEDFIPAPSGPLLEAQPDSVPASVVPREVAAWQAVLRVFVYQCTCEGAAAEATGDDEAGGAPLANYTVWQLPAAELEGMWESLVLDPAVKGGLLSLASSALLFSDAGVSPHAVSVNRVALVSGPPGTGKTSVARAAAHKLAIRMGSRYAAAMLIEINAHSLFSRWFSESGKLVSRLFGHIRDMAEDADTLVCLLIDEVESLTAARTAAMSGGEPSDAIRVVNAVLTAIDSFRNKPNVMLLTTSNITEAIDAAFLDRADFRVVVDLPGVEARHRILKSCVMELVRTELVAGPPARAGVAPTEAPAAAAADDEASWMTLCDAEIRKVAAASHGRSGRALRKLPLQAHAQFLRSAEPCSVATFCEAMLRTLAAMPSAAH